MADGWITIGTELSTNKFDRQIAGLEKKMQKEEDKKIVIEAKLETQEQDLQQAINKTDELADAYQRLKQAQDEISAGGASLATFNTAQDLQNTYGSLEQIDSSFDKALTKQEQLQAKVEGTKLQYKGIVDKVNEYKTKIEGIQIDKKTAELNNMKKGFNGVGNSIEGVIKKVSRLVLGIFGIRSAFMLVRRASSELGTYDKQYATNLEYIRYVLTQAIAPILRYIVNLAATVLSYINAIAQAWFGVNLFANGSAESFKQMKAGAGAIEKSTGGVVKAVKDIKKQLAGFDEMNVLSDQSSGDTGGGGGAGGISAADLANLPEFDLSKIQGNVPKWMEWLLNNGKTVINILKLLGAALVGMKIANFLKSLGLLGEGFSAFQKLLLGLGIGLIIYGIYETVKGIIDFLNEPTLENFSRILVGIASILAGIAISMIAINAASPVGWIMLIVAAVVALTAAIVKNWDKIKETLAPIGKWIKEHIIDPVVEFFKGLWETIKKIFEPVIDFFKSIFETVGRNIQTSIDNIAKIFGFLYDKIKEIFEPIVNFFREKFNQAVDNIKRVFEPIITFFSEIWDRVKTKLSEFGAKVGETVGGAFKNVINATIGAIEWILNQPINAINSLIGVINKLGLNLGYLNTFNLPRLAVGGIVNVPNKGTLVGGAIAGESGPEGVIPLTDAQAMEILGEAIGRYITINATIENKMNGRTISRELAQIRNEQEFAYNM